MAHVHGGPATGRYLGWSIILTLAFVAGEAVAGYASNSLALLSDAGHNFADALALILSWYAVRVGRWPADARRTFGYHRVGVLVALANAVSLVVIALLIFWEAVQRFRSPEPVQSGWMIGVAAGAIVLNALITVWLRGEAKHDLNIRSAYLHMLGDALSAAGVVAAGVLIALTGRVVFDPAVSLLIGGFILWSSWGILSESVNVLLEAVPKGLDVDEVVQAIRRVPGVRDVHHLHVWTISPGMPACSCHVIVGEQSARDGQRVQQSAAELLREQFHIAHTTIQVEVDGCDAGAADCAMRPLADHDHHE
ncbi:MAG TPA: cation diffusion facilitator family transporter [Gemmataceae bacterium]|jgi:cobalt-zinc-cadmium efflux system protein